MLDPIIMSLLWLCCLACQIKPEDDRKASTSQEFVDRVLHGTKAIAEYMGVSPATISRWRTRFRGREEIRLCFPAILMPTGKGWGFRMMTHTVLIKEWMERWWQIDCAAAQGKAKWRRIPPKVKRLGETSKRPGAPIEEKRPQPTREAVEQNSSTTTSFFGAIDGDSGQTVPQELRAEVESQPEPPSAELPPFPANPEPTPAPKRAKDVIPEGCTCGHPTIKCIVCEQQS